MSFIYITVHAAIQTLSFFELGLRRQILPHIQKHCKRRSTPLFHFLHGDEDKTRVPGHSFVVVSIKSLYSCTGTLLTFSPLPSWQTESGIKATTSMCASKVPFEEEQGDGQDIAKGGVAVPFPWRLHNLLKAAAEEGMDDVVSWAPHGRAFTVHQPKRFAEGIMKRYVWNVSCRG